MVRFFSGAMFADDFEFYTYGEQPNADVLSNAPEDYIFGYEVYDADPDTVAPVLGEHHSSLKLSSGVTRYATKGAAISIPSEQLGFYFGGMTEIASLFDFSATTPSNALITVDMSTFGSPSWSNRTLPEYITSRADGQLLWIPVSTQGILVSIGGVIFPETSFSSALTPSQISESRATSPYFLSRIDVYDIHSNTWYKQETTGGERLGQLTGLCAVVAKDESSSTYNIYIHGGYSGIAGNNVLPSKPSDDVWVLSIPSFRWTKVYDGDLNHGRYFHTCVSPYPNQMWVVGGIAWEQSCLNGSAIKIFDLNTLFWQDAYDPAVWSEYQSPETIKKSLQAAEASGSTVNGIAVNMNPDLEGIFKTSYQKPINTYYPYTESNGEKLENDIKQSLSGWFGGVLGITFYLFLCSISITAIVIIRRRMLLRRNGAEPLASGNGKYSRLVRWMNNMKADVEEKEALMEHDHREPTKRSPSVIEIVLGDSTSGARS